MAANAGTAGHRTGRSSEPLAPVAEGRRADRKDIILRSRIFREAQGKLVFEAWAQTRYLGLNGVYIDSTAIPRVGANLSVELFLEHTDETLVANGQVAFVNDLTQDDEPTGFGLTFDEMDPENHERLMRYFVLKPVEKTYELLVEEFPHLQRKFTLQDFALAINYWEDHRHDLTKE
jgi:hypothetical protein